ncbi:MAG: twin-arginine translocase TatA/TatE family subunit [Solirubrobacterales bacterium]|nr:twin-arginine translocase TatA/TatE family subunit [Solirubrobacterales bacterium]
MFTGMLTPGHLMLVLAVVVMLFGTKRLPEVGRSLGAGLRDFKHSLDGRDEPDRLDRP